MSLFSFLSIIQVQAWDHPPGLHFILLSALLKDTSPRDAAAFLQSCFTKEFNLEKGGARKHLPSPPHDDSSSDLAPISTIIQINSNDYWLIADANYCGPGEIWPEFAIIKLSCVVQMPNITPFTTDWANVMDNLCWLQDAIAMPKFTMKQGLFTTAGPCGPCFRLHHVLFKALDTDNLATWDGAGSGAQSNKDKTNDLDPIFSIENWPTFSDAARGGLDSIRQMHWVIPIPAYDLEGKLIDPCFYHCYLEGAVVELHFNLSHWSILRQGIPGKDVYTADIVMMHVLVPPHASATPCTPLKRKVSAYIHLDSSPTKCLKV
ncbi:hypothetical protein F5J12DRAFT_898182 [Pisolithus orientalis]|uniref:uncharacterized protein n=1 Tax=Pisolithus orientalis TaxID=936130 RepID=UPI00222448D3|nr:uncharacterized protein F5J12DRAFT_898182 [Pisolithus orientalis]KAI5988492.1 hypothetical protein F5J12DRAFT_898182 [Pisolithus orientalis]